ncbi:uncharacterized protein J3R85_005207 [Psidium guajava]|nr:uncharacterized protein J3R85_005207 [Psidium guajava]
MASSTTCRLASSREVIIRSRLDDVGEMLRENDGRGHDEERQKLTTSIGLLDLSCIVGGHR